MRVLLITPPLTQLNTPYPGTAYLAGFLKGPAQRLSSLRLDVRQADAGLDLILRVFSARGLKEVDQAFPHALPDAKRRIATVDAVVRFLQGKDPALALRIASRDLLPEGPRFAQVHEEELGLAFGALGVQDRAKYLASLFIDETADAIRAGVDARFGLSRYGEKLAASSPSFDDLALALNAQPTWLDACVDEVAMDLFRAHKPDIVGFSAPFPGNVYGAFRMAQVFKRVMPGVKTVLGGGYVNTELRELMKQVVQGAEPDARIFKDIDAITFDDGERPLLNLLEYWGGKRPHDGLLRTLIKTQGSVRYVSNPKEHDIPARETGCPTYQGLRLDEYLSICELLNPMHRIWSDGRWNKLTVAHGCYWKKCNFCDVSLDYIGRYDPAGAALTVDRMQELISETGQSGFHFVDEAAPPAALKAIAEEILRRGLAVTWWGNVRFEAAFTPEVCALLARSGCVAVSGGLEVASDRLLTLMNKGVTVEQVARVTHAFTQAGVMVHAYLMYGFPTQTDAETVDSAERVRQLFAAGCLQSAFWHRFSATAHSPIGLNPGQFGITLAPETPTRFARNDLEFRDPTIAHHDLFGPGLKRALYNYMQGRGLDQDVRMWFVEAKQQKIRVPGAQVAPDLVRRALSQAPSPVWPARVRKGAGTKKRVARKRS